MTNQTSDPFDHDALDDRRATHLIELCVAGPWRPVDDAIVRLQRDDGSVWFEECVLGGLGVADDWSASLATLEEAKERAKDLMADAATRDDMAVATVCYFLAVAAALVHHDRLISSQPPEQLAPVLADLSTALPASWSDLVMDASWRLSARQRGWHG